MGLSCNRKEPPFRTSAPPFLCVCFNIMLNAVPTKSRQRVGDFFPLCLDDVHQFLRRSGVHIRLLVRIDGLEVVDSVLDLLGPGGQIPRVACQFFGLCFGLLDGLVISRPCLLQVGGGLLPRVRCSRKTPVAPRRNCVPRLEFTR